MYPNYLMNPYTYQAPTNIFSKLLGGKLINKVSLSNILNGASKTLNVVNQTIPLVNQVKPMISNAKTMFQVLKEFNKNDKTIKNTNTETKQEIIKEETIIENTNNPTFFI